MKHMVDVYKSGAPKWPWVSDCDRCHEQRQHGTHALALEYAFRHVEKHELAGFRNSIQVAANVNRSVLDRLANQ